MISSILLGISFQLILLNPISWSGQDVTTWVAVAVIFLVSVEVAISRSVMVSVTVKNSDMVEVTIISVVSVMVMVIVFTSANELHWLMEAALSSLELELFGLELPGRLARRKMVKKLLKKLVDWASATLPVCAAKAKITTNINNEHLFMMEGWMRWAMISHNSFTVRRKTGRNCGWRKSRREASGDSRATLNGWSTPNGLGWLAALGSYLYISSIELGCIAVALVKASTTATTLSWGTVHPLGVLGQGPDAYKVFLLIPPSCCCYCWMDGVYDFSLISRMCVCVSSWPPIEKQVPSGRSGMRNPGGGGRLLWGQIATLFLFFLYICGRYKIVTRKKKEKEKKKNNFFSFRCPYPFPVRPARSSSLRRCSYHCGEEEGLIVVHTVGRRSRSESRNVSLVSSSIQQDGWRPDVMRWPIDERKKKKRKKPSPKWMMAMLDIS